MDNKIYEKLANVQMNLLKKPLKKSGYNSFGKFNYFELKDILPAIMEECYKEGLILTFSFMEDYAILKIRDTDSAELVESNRVSVPKLEIVKKGMNVMQSYGSYMTYIKRYLLLNTFLLDEDSVIDSEVASESPKKQLKQRKETPEKQRVSMDTSNVEVKNFKNPSEYLAYFEGELVSEGYEITKQSMFKKCTEQRLVNKSFKPLEKQVRKLIIEKYQNGGKK